MCPSFLISPCFPVFLVLFMHCMAKVGLVKAMGVLSQDVSRDLEMTSTDFGIAIGLLISVGGIASKSLPLKINFSSGKKKK